MHMPPLQPDAKVLRESTSLRVLAGLRKATEAAAVAAAAQIGSGSGESIDGVAIDAMHDSLAEFPFAADLVMGQGDRSEAPKLYTGQPIGDAQADLKFDCVVDPGEGTTYLAAGLTNAMTVVALAPQGSMWIPSPALYVEKFIAPPAARGQIDPAWRVDEKLAALGKVLGKEVEELTIFVQEKPRHRALIDQIREVGAEVSSFPAGDVAGSLLAALPHSQIDALMGTGGLREGMIAACAARALGAEFCARLSPQLHGEKTAVRAAGLDLERWYTSDQWVGSTQTYVCATGITTGLLLEGVERVQDQTCMQTIMISGATGESQLLTTWQRCVGEARR
jgi:fructose-1,6-bisphosphatase II